MARTNDQINTDPISEARRLVSIAAEKGFKLRALGGVAVALRVPKFQRILTDIDFIIRPKQGSRVAILLRNLGYEPHIAFNALHSDERLLFFDDTNSRHLDLFVGDFRMSHTLPYTSRFELEPLTIPLAELILTKLQLAQITEKDIDDTLALFSSHPVGEEDGETINADVIAQLCASDWGLWRTLTTNLALCQQRSQSSVTESRITDVLTRIDTKPKTNKWRLRSLVGEHKRWYEIPEEPSIGPDA